MTLRGSRRQGHMPLVLLPHVIVLVAAGLALRPAEISRARASDPVIAAAGDIACSSNTPTATTCHQGYTSDILVAGGFDAVLALGDNQYPSGELSDFRAYFDPTWGRVRTRIQPVPGNHEYQSAGAAGYFDYFGPAAGNPSSGYYSLDVGTWHIIALNSNCDEVGGCHAGSPQEQWLRTDLASHRSACTLAYWHHPRFSSDTVHGSDSRMQAFWEALYDFHADVVLNGHAHDYERFDPQTPIGLSDPAGGIRQFVVGTGGRSQYAFRATPLANSVVRHSGTFGVLKLTLHPTGYTWEFLAEAGRTFTDAGSALCATPQTVEVALSAKRRVISAGGRTGLIAAVGPCQGRDGDPIVFQRRRRKVWKTVMTRYSDQHCRAKTKVRLRRATSFRAMSPADSDHRAASSNIVKVRVMNPRRVFE
jgi:calcineurin-like phosphoesterase family protein